MYTHICNQARADPLVKCVRLYVETGNLAAQAVYKALGMQELIDYNFDEVDFVFGH